MYFKSELQSRLALILTWAMFFLPFFRARVSGENWSGALFALGWVFIQEKRLLAAGLLLGWPLSCVFRWGF